MLKQHNVLVYRSLVLIDLAVTVAAFLAAYWARNIVFLPGHMGRLFPLERYTWLLFVIIPVWFILLKAFDAYRSYRTYSYVYELLGVGKAIFMGGLAIGTVAFVTKAEYLSRTFIISFVFINLILVGLVRLAIRSLSWFVRERGYNFRNVVIVGTEHTARDIARRVVNFRESGLRILGFVTDNEHQIGSEIDGHPVIGTLGELESFVKREAVDEVIFAIPGRKLEALEDTLLMLEEHGINARIVSNIFPHIIARMSVEEFETVPLLTFSTVPANDFALALKRLGDIGMSIFLLICSSPFMAIAAVLIKATSPGPVLFRQRRCGLHGRLFTLYKFRSMYCDAEAMRSELDARNEMAGPAFKIKDDPRVTPVGRFLRTTSIDELPQLWNVLRGDMSIVGPRPPIPGEVDRYERWQRRRLSMRPGITCIWQISGRNKINDFDEWVRLDLQYIDTWSIALDINIFLKTIPVVLLRKGAA